MNTASAAVLISSAKNRTALHAVAKDLGVVVPRELRRQLTLGGLRDYVRKAVQA